MLHIAAEKGYASIVKLLLKKANPNAQDSLEQTALYLATQKGHKEVAELLME